MKLPNKVTSYKESVLGKFYPILNLLKSQDMYVYELYKKIENHFETTADFIDALDFLFALGTLDLFKKDDKEVLHYAL